MALIPFQKGLKIKQTRQSTRLKPFVPVKRAPRDITQNYENIRKQAQQYANEAKKQNSWQSLALNTIKGLPQATRDIWSNVKQHPIETTKSVGSGILKGLEPFHKAQQWSNPAYLISKGIDKVAGTQLAKHSEDAWDRMANYEPKNNINRDLKQGFEFGASTVPYSVGGELAGATKLAKTSPRLAKYLGWTGTSQAVSDKKLTDVKGRAEQLALDTALFGLTGGMKKPKVGEISTEYKSPKITSRELAYNATVSKKKKPVIIDPDIFKKQHNDYSPANHWKYSEMAKKEYAKQLRNNKNGLVKFVAGGSGSGKSELVIENIGKGFDGIIYDGTMANYKNAVKKIEQAAKAGKKIEIDAILPRLESALKFVQRREIEKDRGVPLNEFIKKHTGFVDTLKRIIKKYPNVEVALKDTRGSFTKAEAEKAPFITDREKVLDILDKVDYNKDRLNNLKYVKLSEKSKRKSLAAKEMVRRGEARTIKEAKQQLKRGYGKSYPVVDRRGTNTRRLINDTEILGIEKKPSFNNEAAFKNGLKNISKEKLLSKANQGLTENSSNLYHNGIDETIPTPKTSGYKKSTPLDQVPLKDKLSYASSVSDNANNVKEKVALIDYFKTPKYVLEKIGLGKQAEKLDRAYETYQKDTEKEMHRIISWKQGLSDKNSSKNIFKWLDGQDVQLTGKEKQVGEKIKKYLSDWADKLGLPEDKRITHYITHIFDKNLLQKEFDPELAKIIADKPAGSVYDPFLQKRLGKQGYKEDVWSALSAYVKRATRKYNLDPALKDLKNSADFQSLENVKYITRLTNGINMRPTELDNLIDNTIKQSSIGYKLGQRPTNLLTRNIRQQIYRGGLGLNVGSALKNLSQGINTYAELGEKYTAKGYLDLITKGTKELKNVGVLDNGLIEDKSLPVYKSLLQKADKALFYLFEKAEMINRGSAYYGAKAKALAKGMSEEKAQAYAKNIVAKTQFKFGGVHTPVAMNSDLAKTLLQFQTFGLKQLEFVGGKVKNKEWESLLRYIGGTLAVYGLIGKSIGWDVGDISIPSFRFSSPTTSILGSAYEYATAQGDKYKQAKARNDLMRSASLLVPAGGQLKKTYQGLGAYNRGYSQTPSGNVRFPVAKSTRNLIQAPTLGQWSLPEAKTYFQTKANSLGKNQTKTFRSLPEDKRKDFYNKILYDRKINKFDRDIKEARKNHDEELIKKLINEKNKIKPYY